MNLYIANEKFASMDFPMLSSVISFYECMLFNKNLLPAPSITFWYFTGFKFFPWYLFQVWARIWSVLANHFISAGSHHDEKIAMYAIDSLRQLGMKYLERAELANFTFQNDILKPFVVLMRNSRSQSIRRLIVDCIVQVCDLAFLEFFINSISSWELLLAITPSI